MDFLSKISETAIKCGFREYGYVEIKNLKYYPEVREICEGNMCRNYGTSWACPPAVGTIAECRTRVAQYDKMMIFSQVYSLEDSFDSEGMIAGLQDFKHLVDRFQQDLTSILHHSLEGYGFIVNELATEAGIRYNNGANTVTYFGALLYKEH